MGCFTSFYDWSKTLAATLSTNHIDRKLKPIMTLSHALARALGSLLVFTDDLVVSWVVEVGSTVAIADAFVDAVIGVPVVNVPFLDTVLLTTAIVDAVATSPK